VDLQLFEQTTEGSFDEPGITTFSVFECELQCLDGTCITKDQLNDGVIDCPDGTDEKDMPKN